MRYVLHMSLVAGLVVLAGCDQVAPVTGLLTRTDPASETADAPEATGDPLAAPLAQEAVPVDPAAAASVETTEIEPATGATATTIAALGDPARAGAWMETPLVTAETAGEVRYGGKGLKVTLIPAGGPATGGSRLSLEAMQALGLPLADLTEVQVVY